MAEVNRRVRIPAEFQRKMAMKDIDAPRHYVRGRW